MTLPLDRVIPPAPVSQTPPLAGVNHPSIVPRDSSPPQPHHATTTLPLGSPRFVATKAAKATKAKAGLIPRQIINGPSAPAVPGNLGENIPHASFISNPAGLRGGPGGMPGLAAAPDAGRGWGYPSIGGSHVPTPFTNPQDVSPGVFSRRRR